MKKRLIRVGKRELNTNNIRRIRRRFDELLDEDPEKQITLLFENCTGGNADLVYELTAYLIERKACIRTKNCGEIDSAAPFLFLVGQEREATESSKIFFHPFKVAPKEIRMKYIEQDFALWTGQVRRLCVDIVRYVVSRTNLTVHEVEEFLSGGGVSFDSRSAYATGILTRVIPNSH